MSAEDKRGPLQLYLAGNDGLSSAYAKTKQDITPPSEVDAAILQAAREHTAPSDAKVLMFPHRWMAPLAAAATLILVVGISQWFGGPTKVRDLQVVGKAVVSESRAPDQSHTQAAKAPSEPLPGSSVTRSELRREKPPDGLTTSGPAQNQESIRAFNTPSDGSNDYARPHTLPDNVAKAQTKMGEKSNAQGLKKSDESDFATSATGRSRAKTATVMEEPSAPGFEPKASANGVGGYRAAPKVANPVVNRKIVGPATHGPSAYFGNDTVKQRQNDARLAAQRLNIPYQQLPQQIWRERLQTNRTQWWAQIEKLFAAGDLVQLRAELAAFAAIHGVEDPQVVQQAQRLRTRTMPPNK